MYVGRDCLKIREDDPLHGRDHLLKERHLPVSGRDLVASHFHWRAELVSAMLSFPIMVIVVVPGSVVTRPTEYTPNGSDDHQTAYFMASNYVYPALGI